MALTKINGQDGTAKFAIATVDYECVLDMFRIREIIELLVADTFCEEGRADQEPGRSQLVGELTGFLTKGEAISGPLIPAPQNVAILAQYSTGCTIALTANFAESSADRMVNDNARLSARFVSKADYVVTWATGP